MLPPANYDAMESSPFTEWIVSRMLVSAAECRGPFFAEVSLRFSFDRYPEFPTRMWHNLCLSNLTVPRLFPMK